MCTSTTLLEIGTEHTEKFRLIVTRDNLWSATEVKLYTRQRCTAHVLYPYCDRTTEYNLIRQYENFGWWKSSFCVKIRLQVWSLCATNTSLLQDLKLLQRRRYLDNFGLITPCQFVLSTLQSAFHLQCLCNPHVTEMSATIYQLSWVNIPQQSKLLHELNFQKDVISVPETTEVKWKLKTSGLKLRGSCWR